MSTYAIVQGKIKNRDKLEEYTNKVQPILEAYGIRVVAFSESPEIIEGTPEHLRTVVLEFSSREVFHTWYESSEYQEVLPLRLNSAPGTFIIMDGLDR